MEILGGRLRREVVRHEDEKSGAAKKLHRLEQQARERRVRAHADVTIREIQVEPSQYWRERIISGDAIAASRPTAAACGISSQDFRGPVDLFSEYLARLMIEWKAGNDEPAAIAGYVVRVEVVKDVVEVKLADAPSKVPALEVGALASLRQALARAKDTRAAHAVLRDAFKGDAAALATYFGKPATELSYGELLLWFAEAIPPRVEAASDSASA